jgi:hypothetical protein
MEEYIILCYEILMNIAMHGIGERTRLGISNGRLDPFMDPCSSKDLKYNHDFVLLLSTKLYSISFNYQRALQVA